MEDFKYLGHEADYWLELEKKAQNLNVQDLIEELVKAYGKNAFYEKRISEMFALAQQ